jgi:hypothetical protein
MAMSELQDQNNQINYEHHKSGTNWDRFLSMPAAFDVLKNTASAFTGT